MRTAVLSLALLLGAAAAVPALAEAPGRVELRVSPRHGLVLGGEHRLSGTLFDGGGRPAPGQLVTLDARAPGGGPFVRLDSATTGAQGQYRFARVFRRNTRVRASGGGSTAGANAYVFPRAGLSVRAVRRNVVRLRQVLTGPSTARIRGRTRFYLGRRGARTAPLRATARVHRVRAGRFVARAEIRVPVRYGGRFAYAACFRAGRSSSMGDPGLSCARRFRF